MRLWGHRIGVEYCNTLVRIDELTHDIRSEIGKGSEFSFVIKLPLAEARDGNEMMIRPSVSQTWSLRDKFRVLYIDDVEPNQFFMVAMAEQLTDIELTLASSALEGYELIKRQSFELVLTDIQMPEHDGLELLRWVREDSGIDENLPVLAFTAHAEHDRIEQFLSVGFDYVLTKPLEFEKLHDTMQRFKRKNST